MRQALTFIFVLLFTPGCFNGVLSWKAASGSRSQSEGTVSSNNSNNDSGSENGQEENAGGDGGDLVDEGHSQGLALSPSRVRMSRGFTKKFTATGGSGYLFSMEDGNGTIDPASGVFRPTDVGNATVKVSDIGLTSAFATITVPSSGTLDETLAPSGIAQLSLTAGVDEIHGAALTSDGKMIVVGRIQSLIGGSIEFMVARLHSDGSLDTSFATEGIYSSKFGAEGATARAAVVQPDGKILVVGNSYSASDMDGILIRLSAEGQPDPTFAKGVGRDISLHPGVYRFDFDGGMETFNDLILDEVGNIVVTGRADSPGKLFVGRFLSTGVFDGTFSSPGDPGFEITFLSSPSSGEMVRLDPDGNVVICGSTTLSFGSNLSQALIAARYSPLGTADPSFTVGESPTGMAMYQFGGEVAYASAFDFQPDGKIVLVGQLDGKMLTVRLLHDGKLDPNFTASGFFAETIAAGNTLSRIKVQPDGRILVGGQGNGQLIFRRYLEDATPDTGFGDFGWSVLGTNGLDILHHMIVEETGRVTAFGSATQSSSDSLVLRFFP